jgi:hypothetical protein
MRHSAFKLLAMPILTSLAVALAAAPPNFSGSWTMNAAKSDFGPMPAPIRASSKIEHQDPDDQGQVGGQHAAGRFQGEHGQRRISH